jgi:dihydropteroate synthase
MTKPHPFVWGDRTYLMAVLNVTPDSFSDGGEFVQLDQALAQADRLLAQGADILDIGGQSTRPGAVQIDRLTELERVIPVIRALRNRGIVAPISVDTTRAAVAEAAIAAGANWINDISGGTFEPEILRVAAQTQAPIVLMHIRGTPQTMQTLTDYQDLIGEISTFLQHQVDQALAVGVQPQQIILDPGIGFGKTSDQNLEILRQLPQLKTLGYPLLLGPSRKSFIGHILNQPDPKQRVWGTGAACCGAIAGGADVVRVHDLPEMYELCRVADRIWRPSKSG